ncbi:MAG: hypothetical protein HFH86_00195 [Bacilli bacterium]|jgi:hypothetical protein|nr:hypothetical protein [Bacilli bacterium]
MRKHISYYYKSYDGQYQNELERKIQECCNDYGYNLETNRRREMNIDESAAKSQMTLAHRYGKRE